MLLYADRRLKHSDELLKDYKCVITLIFSQSEGLKDFRAQTPIYTIGEASNPIESEKR